MGNINKITSPDFIIEPGEKFKINLVLYNNTMMTTPVDSPLTINLLEDPLIN